MLLFYAMNTREVEKTAKQFDGARGPGRAPWAAGSAAHGLRRRTDDPMKELKVKEFVLGPFSLSNDDPPTSPSSGSTLSPESNNI